jgi:hypothetical protein
MKIEIDPNKLELAALRIIADAKAEHPEIDICDPMIIKGAFSDAFFKLCKNEIEEPIKNAFRLLKSIKDTAANYVPGEE